MRQSFELYLALRYLRFHRGRTFLSIITLISVAGFTVGTAALVVALSLMAGFVEDVRSRIHSGSAHLWVLSGEPRPFAGADELVRRASAVPGVSAAGPVLNSPAMIAREDLSSPEFAEMQGVDPAIHAAVILDDDQDDPFPALARPTASGRPGIVLGEELARRVGVAPGDLVRTLVPELTLAPWGALPHSRVFEVVASFHSDHFLLDSQRAYVGLAEAQRLLRVEGQASWVEIRLDDLGRLEPMKQAVGAELGSAWYVVDLVEQNRELIRALNTEKLVLFFAIGLIVVVAALNIVSALILLVNDKVKEIGTLAAMGARPREVAKVFVLQGLVIGTVGTLIGLVVGATLSWALDHYQAFKLNPEVYYLTHVPFTLQPLDLFLVAVASLLIALLATIYPAVKAARLDPVEAIRHE